MIYSVVSFKRTAWARKNNDKTYGTICLETIEKGDLCLRDLGYFDLSDLQAIHDKRLTISRD